MNREDTVNLRNVFSMLQAVCQHTKRESLSFGDGFITGLSIDHNTCQLRNFANPTSVRFTLDVHCKVAHTLPCYNVPSEI